jgi:hypothetical protein
MKKIEIYVFEEMDDLDLLNSQINKGWLSVGCAVKVGEIFYQVGFYNRYSIVHSFTNATLPCAYYINIIVVEELTIKLMQEALIDLYNVGYFEHLKGYPSYEAVKFFPYQGRPLKGKLLSSIVSNIHRV